MYLNVLGVEWVRRMQALFDSALLESATRALAESSATLDARFGLPAGASAAAVSAAVAALTLLLCTRVCAGTRSTKSVRQRRKTVLLAGPVGSGKTLMLHRVRVRSLALRRPSARAPFSHILPTRSSCLGRRWRA